MADSPFLPEVEEEPASDVVPPRTIPDTTYRLAELTPFMEEALQRERERWEPVHRAAQRARNWCLVAVIVNCLNVLLQVGVLVWAYYHP